MFDALDAANNDHDLNQPEDPKHYELVSGYRSPPAPHCLHQAIESASTNPRLNAEPSASDQRPGHGGDVRPASSEARAAQHWKRDAILGSRVGIQDHRDQDDRIAEQNRQHGLPPIHS